MIRNTFYTLCLIFSSQVYQDSSASVQWSVATLFRSQSFLRGAKTWPNPSLSIGPSLTINKFSIQGPNVFYSAFGQRDKYQFKSGIRLISDGDPLFKFDNREEDFRNQRDTSLEAYITGGVSFFKRNALSLEFTFSKETIEHKGLFLEAKARYVFLPFTWVNMTLGIGEKKTNQYLYGPSSVSGSAYRSLGLAHMLRNFLPWNGLLFNSIDLLTISQETNRSAEFIRGDDNNLLYGLLAIWRL